MADKKTPEPDYMAHTQPDRSVAHYLRVADTITAESAAGAQPAAAEPPLHIDITEEIAREQKLKNDNVEQDIALKRSTLNRLFRFLTAETVLIFAFTLFQAIKWPFGFQLDEWSFKLVVAATIAQITGMLFVAVRYLFPKAK